MIHFLTAASIIQFDFGIRQICFFRKLIVIQSD